MEILYKHFTECEVLSITKTKKSLLDYLIYICKDIEKSEKSYKKALDLKDSKKRNKHREFFMGKIDRLLIEKNNIIYFVKH